jgi:hypothetical protein
MRTPRIRLETVTRSDRFVCVESASAAIQAAGGWIEDVNFFSNVSVVIQFSLPPGAVDAFLAAVTAAGLPVDSAATAAIIAAEPPPGADTIAASLNITFVHEAADLRRTIPMMPG